MLRLFMCACVHVGGCTCIHCQPEPVRCVWESVRATCVLNGDGQWGADLYSRHIAHIDHTDVWRIRSGNQEEGLSAALLSAMNPNKC